MTAAARPLPPLLLRGDCLARLRDLPDNSIDAVVTDPPYGLDFMGKAWDRFTPLDFEKWCESWAAEALRVLKPGGHLLAFGGSRTWHRLAAGIEDAGFEVRDSIAWLYGSGFPKSLDVSKAIDKAAGAEREKKRTRARAATSGTMSGSTDSRPWIEASRELGYHESAGDTPATPEAAAWQGWGTALKPAFEPIVVARKPLAKGHTVAANVLQYGTGALNIDAARVAGAKPDTTRGASSKASSMAGPLGGQGRIEDDGRGRWPANVVLDESQAAALDEQSGTLKGGGYPGKRSGDGDGVERGVLGTFGGQAELKAQRLEGGGPSRFFYVAKAPKSERPVTVDPETGARVAHPTVKPLALMRWLVRLVTPEGGVVLDPFAGSGTTLEAAHLEGFEAIGVELTLEYWPLIESRIERAIAARAKGGS